MSKKVLFAASTGGHLAQLVRLESQFGASEDSLWVTFRTPQSESLLAGKRTLFVPYIKPRDWRGVYHASRIVRNLTKHESFDQAVSTGAALAVSVLPAAHRAGIKTTYIESVSRVSGPSLSGRILRLLGTADLKTQHRGWARGPWKYTEGVLASFQSIQRPRSPRPKVFVTLGTIEKYRFDAAIDSLLATGLMDERTVWQVGATQRSDLPGLTHSQMSAKEFADCVRAADVVVTHSGVGTILQLLDMGTFPVIIPRDQKRNEHVDNHQYEIAELMSSLGIGLVRTPDELIASDLVEVSGKAIIASRDHS